MNRAERRSLPVRGAWIEILTFPDFHKRSLSLPVRGAWIEIAVNRAEKSANGGVAPRAGSVD